MNYETSPEPMTVRTVKRLYRQTDGRWPFVPYGLVPVIGLAVLLIYGLTLFAFGSVQAETARTARLALSDAGIDWARIRVSGQQVFLEGEAPSAAEAERAIVIVRKANAPTPLGPAPPATRVTGRLNGVADAKPLSATPPVTDARKPGRSAPGDWSFQLGNGALTLSGEVPDEATHAAILQDARSRLDPPRLASIDDQLVVSGGAAPSGYLAVATRALDTVSACDTGTAALRAEVFTLKCELPASAAADVRAKAYADLPWGKLGDVTITTREEINTCETSLATLLGDARIEFASGSAVIEPSSNALIDSIAAAVKSCPGTLRIEGYTDVTGEPALNMALSRNRAFAVRNALIARSVSQQRLIAEGYGESRPLADNTTPDGRARNRRIEIRVVRASE